MSSFSSAYPNLECAVLRVRIVLNLLGALLSAVFLAGMDSWQAIAAYGSVKSTIDLVSLAAVAIFLLRSVRLAFELRRLNRAIAGQPRLQRLRENSVCGD